jgi:Zn-dependent protease
MSGFRVARIMGFEVRVDYSWFIIFFLILWSFTSGVFPARAPGLEPWAYALMGGTGAVFFFVSLLLHELSHSVVARAKGIPVAGITLFLFGGMAHTTKEAETPGDEFLIAVVGPVSSMLISLGLGAIVWLGIRADWHPAVLIVGEYLAALNFALAIFNLLPGFPLDGGRLLRAAVWKVTGDVTRATRVAAGAGKLLGYALVALGLWLAIRGDLLGGVWLGFIGWFLRNAAVASLQQRLTQDVLEGVLARDTMVAAPAAVPADRPLDDLVQEFVVRQESAVLPVERRGTIVGLVSLKQVKTVPREQWPATTAGDIMVPADADLVVSPLEPMSAVLNKLRTSPLRRVLVMENGRLAGVIAPNDVAAWFQRMRGQEA